MAVARIIPGFLRQNDWFVQRGAGVKWPKLPDMFGKLRHFPFLPAKAWKNASYFEVVPIGLLLLI
jgi:hypothetical protein